MLHPADFKLLPMLVLFDVFPLELLKLDFPIIRLLGAVLVVTVPREISFFGFKRARKYSRNMTTVFGMSALNLNQIIMNGNCAFL
jgi:hypothetical protein